MRKYRVLSVAGALVALAAAPRGSHAVEPCSSPEACAKVDVGVSAADPLKPGDTFAATVSFTQGADDAQAGGIDNIAAIALTLGMPGGGSGNPPIELADCTLNEAGLPASVTPDPAISNFFLVVENASCANGKTHCLCPDAGQTKDDFINLVVYGPNPLPTPGSNVSIPTLPAGPQSLVSLSLKVAASANGQIPLRVYNRVANTSTPQYTAFLSVGDTQAVDQTCGPQTPPCGSDTSVSEVVVTGNSVNVAGAPCTGDCNGDGQVAVNELIVMVNISLEQQPTSNCPIADKNGDGAVTITEIITAVNYALTQCPTQ